MGACMYMYVCVVCEKMYVDVHMCVQIHVFCMYIWKPEASFRCHFSGWLSTLFLETEYLMGTWGLWLKLTGLESLHTVFSTRAS